MTAFEALFNLGFFAICALNGPRGLVIWAVVMLIALSWVIWDHATGRRARR